MRLNSLRWQIHIMLLMLVGIASTASPARVGIPLTGIEVASQETSQEAGSETSLLPAFIHQMTNGLPGRVTGIYSSGIFALPVVQQPSTDPAYISDIPDAITQFGLASTYGSLGFIAHNTLAGSLFTKFVEGNVLVIVYGDGSYRIYQVSRVRRFRAITPDSPYSSFIDLDLGSRLNYDELFYQTYGVSGEVVLQTCITAEGNTSWGRLFIIASPIHANFYFGREKVMPY